MKLFTVTAIALASALAIAGCNRTSDQSATPGEGNMSQAPAPQSTVPNGAPGAAESAGASAGAAIDDATVTAKVKAALAATDGISGTDISVETQQGTVILTGKVADATQSQRAAQVAQAVEGVRSVDNRLQSSS